MFSCGDHVVYRMKKFTVRPGPRAKQIQPAEHGDFYDYIVDKFWIVEEVLNDGRLILRTRRGKKHIVDENHLSALAHGSIRPYPPAGARDW